MMWNLSMKLFKGCCALGIFLNSCGAYAITPMVINKETPQYIIQIKYPQGFTNPKVNQAVKEFIESAQKSFLNELSEDADTPADAPGKTGLNVTYSLPYQSTHALSIRFNVSIYHRGAAHPANTVVVQNFIKGEHVVLADLFVAGADYLKPIAAFSRQAITKKKISDAQWINEGTKPTVEHYATWSFAPQGIDILFNTYQVAAYVYGEQTVSIPLTAIKSLLKPDVSQNVWGN